MGTLLPVRSSRLAWDDRWPTNFKWLGGNGCWVARNEPSGDLRRAVGLGGRTGECAPSFVRVLLANLSAIMGAAVEDRLILSNPCAAKAVKPPALDGRRVEPWTRKQVHAVTAAHPSRYRAVPIVGAGLGLRQGEVFGIRVEDIDFLRRRVLVRQQLKLVKGRPIFAPPKGAGNVRSPCRTWWRSPWPSSCAPGQGLRSRCLGSTWTGRDGRRRSCSRLGSTVR